MHTKINKSFSKNNLFSYKDINKIKTQDILKKIKNIINYR